MDGATFEIWIPKREEEKREVSYYRPGERPGASPTINQWWGRKKALRINHHFERLEGNEGLLENTSIRQSTFILKRQCGEDFHLRSLCRGHESGRATSLIKNRGV